MSPTNRIPKRTMIRLLSDSSGHAALRRSLSGAEDSAARAVALYRRIRKGENAVRVWREHRGLGLNALVLVAAVSAPYLSEVENGVKPGSAAALKKLARALEIDIDEVV